MMPQSRNPPANESGPSFIRSAVQGVAVFILVQFVMKQFMGYGSNGANSKATVAVESPLLSSFSERPSRSELQGPYKVIPQAIAPIWPSNASIDIIMYISPSLVMPSLKSMPPDSVILEERGIKLNNWTEARQVHSTFPVPEEVQNNGTLWGHIYVALSGSSLDPTTPHYDQSKGYHFVRPLTQYFKKKKVKKSRNLLVGDNKTSYEEIESESATAPIIASYFHPNFTLSLVPNSGIQSFAGMHPAIRQWVQLESTGARDISGQHGWYYPILFLNDFWQLRAHMTELNDTVTQLPINIHINTLSFWKFNMLTTWDAGMKQNRAAAASGNAGLTGSSDGSEFEDIKRILIDSNVYLLITTGVVAVLHMIFEMLAFKSDVSHWRNKKDNVGVSFRTILANVLMQSIIFLYLLDNNESTSWMILMSQGLGIALEAWKVTKTVNVRVRPTSARSWNPFPYSVAFEDKHKLTETEKKTQEADETAFKYLYAIAVPLLLAYAAYSLYYETHTSWYSFIIATLVGSVYAYGFLMMVPALYINYKLKSVAHMPGKTMMYKTLNTFIDDLFAFTIKMPLLHRIATLRDDVIFFIYLYQAWKYKVDYTRVNEFGQGGEEEPSSEAVEGTSPSTGNTTDSSVLYPKAKDEVVSRTRREESGARKRK